MSSILTVVLVATPINVLAHSGGTDSNGCHNDRQNGGYHCHGAPAQSPYNPPVYPNPPVYQNPFPSPSLSPYSPPVYQNPFPSRSPYSPPVYRPPTPVPSVSDFNWLLVGTSTDGEVKMYVETTTLKRIENIAWYWWKLEPLKPLNDINMGFSYVSVDCTKKVQRIRFSSAYDDRGRLLVAENPDDKAPLKKPTAGTLEYLAMMAVCSI